MKTNLAEHRYQRACKQTMARTRRATFARNDDRRWKLQRSWWGFRWLVVEGQIVSGILEQ